MVASALAAGCNETTVVATEEVCAAYCACRSPLETAQEVCATSCEAELAGTFIPDACVTCAQESACVELDDCLDNCFAVPAPAPEEP